MSVLLEHSQKELEILRAYNPEAVALEFDTEILAVVKKFAESGQSGGSAPFTAAAVSETIRLLLQGKPIAPITGDDSEWMEVTGDDTAPVFQNLRESNVFKNPENNGRAHYLDAIIFVDEQETGWNSSACIVSKDNPTKDIRISSHAFIKNFPFTPKTFYIDVITVGAGTDDWDFVVKTPSQLKEVFEYYDVFEGEWPDKDGSRCTCCLSGGPLNSLGMCTDCTTAEENKNTIR